MPGAFEYFSQADLPDTSENVEANASDEAGTSIEHATLCRCIHAGNPLCPSFVFGLDLPDLAAVTARFFQLASQNAAFLWLLRPTGTRHLGHSLSLTVLFKLFSSSRPIIALGVHASTHPRRAHVHLDPSLDPSSETTPALLDT